MVSIHIVPIVVYLTIRVLCFIFRFKREITPAGDLFCDHHRGEPGRVAGNDPGRSGVYRVACDRQRVFPEFQDR